MCKFVATLCAVIFSILSVGKIDETLACLLPNGKMYNKRYIGYVSATYVLTKIEYYTVLQGTQNTSLIVKNDKNMQG